MREALGYAFDFEWTNHNLMYDAYKRTSSYFENSDLEAVGAPTPAELALLEPFRDRAARGSVRRAVSAAGVGRLGPGSRAAAQGASIC